MRTWTSPEVHPAGEGPWHNEPDGGHWVQAGTGFDSLIVRQRRGGHLCGYVGVPAGHPWHGLPADGLPPVLAHRGIEG